MHFFEKASLTAIASLTLAITAISPASTTPEAPMDGEFSSETYARQEGLAFTPPEYSYDPVSSDAPLVRPSTWQAIGENAVVAGDYSNALAAFDKAVQLAPEANPEMLEQRGWIHYSLGYEAEALQDISQAAELHLSESDFSAYSNALSMQAFVDARLDS